MWSWATAIKKDLEEFAHVVAGDTTQLVSSAVAVVGGSLDGSGGEERSDDEPHEEGAFSNVVAGDEDLPESAISKVPKSRIHHLQATDATYLEPLAPAEEYRFRQWVHSDRSQDESWQHAVLTNSVELRDNFLTLVENEQKVERGAFFERYLARLQQLRTAFSKRSVLAGSDGKATGGKGAGRYDDGLEGWDDDEDDNNDDEIRGEKSASSSTRMRPSDRSVDTSRLEQGNEKLSDDTTQVELLRQMNAQLQTENARLVAENAELKLQLAAAKSAAASSPSTAPSLQVDAPEQNSSNSPPRDTSSDPAPPQKSGTADDDDDDWTNLS